MVSLSVIMTHIRVINTAGSQDSIAIWCKETLLAPVLLLEPKTK